jgi:hypothetical protein
LVRTYNAGLSFTLLILGSESLLKILHYCPISPCIQQPCPAVRPISTGFAARARSLARLLRSHRITVLLTYLWTVMILLRLFQETKNIIFTCGDSKNHSWPSPLVIFSVPTRENNVFLLSFHRTVILHCTTVAGHQTACARCCPDRFKLVFSLISLCFHYLHARAAVQ